MPIPKIALAGFGRFLTHFAPASKVGFAKSAISLQVETTSFPKLESQKAFLIGLAACLVITNVSFGSFIGKMLPDNVFLENLFKYFNFTQLFDEMIKGQIGIASLLYFLMIIVFSLVMVETIVEHKKG